MSVPARPAASCRATRAPWWAATLAIVVLVHPSVARPQTLWLPNGAPVCVRPTCGGEQPFVTSLGGGATIVSWRFYLSSATRDDLSAIRLEANGQTNPSWPQAIGGPPVTRAIESQYQTDIAPDGAGGAFIIWNDRRDVLVNGFDVYAQHVLANGQIAPGWPANGLAISTALGRQERGSLLADGTGGVFAFWDSDSTVFAQHLAGDGTRFAGWPQGGLKLLDVPSIGNYGAARVGGVLDGQGGCLVAWGDTRRGLGGEFYVQRLTSAGEIVNGWPANGRRVVDASSVQRERFHSYVVPDGIAGCYIAWESTNDPNAFDDDIYATHVLADGTVAPGWPATGLAVCALNGWQDLTSAVADSSGGLLLAWGDQRDYQAYPAQVYAQRLRPDGTLPPGWQPNGNPISDLPGYQFGPRLAPDGHGGAFVTYQEAFQGFGYVQRVLANGSRPAGWPSVGLRLVDPSIPNTGQQDMVIAPDGSSGAIVVWNDYRNGTQNQLYAQRYSGDDITAVTTSLVSFEALPDRVTLTWARGGEAPLVVSVERRAEGESWQTLERLPFDGRGRLEYQDHAVTPGARYGYRLRWTEAGVEQLSAEATVLVPREIALALEGLRPNPALGDLHVAFSLPRSGSATIEVLDLGGRLVLRREVGSLGIGRHVVRMNEGTRLQPGAYWLRLTHDGRTLTTKGVVLR